MAIFLGDKGRVLLRRNGSQQSIFVEISDADVVAGVNRFSVRYANGQFITGDRIEVKTTDGSDLNWIDDPSADDSFTRYAHVDAAGGIRFYNTFSEAIRSDPANAVQLISPPVPQNISIQVLSDDTDRCLAQVTSYEITTSRETIDTTNLGAFYRKQYESGLIQGQGRIECFWDRAGDFDCDGNDPDTTEFSSYLARLCLRLVHGADFFGQFYVYQGDATGERSVWYESESCIITNVAISVDPDQIVSSTIDFVTSGPIALIEGELGGLLEQEQSSFGFELEQPTGGRINLENTD